MGKQKESVQPELAIKSRKSYADKILIFGILSVLCSAFPIMGIALGIIAICMFYKNKSVKTVMMADIGKTLGIIGLVANFIFTEIEILFFPIPNCPLWITMIREDFFASDFWVDFENNFITDNRYTYIGKGLVTTFKVTIFAALLGIGLGVIVALVRSSYETLKDELKGGFGKGLLFFFYKVCGVYLTVIRGTPVVVQLMIIYFVIFASSNNKILVAVLAFGINSGAYVAEIIRGGIMSVDRGQFEAGRSLGFGYVRTMALIIIPQAFKTVLPSLANEFIVLIKETSVSGYIGLQELTKGGDIIRSRTYSAFMPLIAVALIYLVIVMFFSWLVSLLERGLKKNERR